MPKPVSKAQLKLMHAIMNSKPKKCPHGRNPPDKGVASKYTDSGASGKNLPETKDNCKGGERGQEKKSKKVEKADKKKGVGIVVLNEGKILMGLQPNGEWATPGGKVEDNESNLDAAKRELKEETGLVAEEIEQISSHTCNDESWDSFGFMCPQWSGALKPNDEFERLQFVAIEDIPWDNMRRCSVEGVKAYLCQRLSESTTKSLVDLVAVDKATETLEKNIIRSTQMRDAVHDVTHGDALQVVGNGTFRMLRNAVEGMTDEDFRELTVDSYTLSIRKHANDIYSGRILDGHKMIHQFTNKSLPALATELMSVFEWYMPEDAKELEIVDDSKLQDSDIKGGLKGLMEDYYKHNVTNIYKEMENIRQEIRLGNAVDLQVVEQRIMKLFDKLENSLSTFSSKHNDLVDTVDEEIRKLEQKLLQLQTTIDELGKQPSTVNAYVPDPDRKDSVHSEYYPYLSTPTVSVQPNGSVRISFGTDWMVPEQENFLKDMRARVIGQKGNHARRQR